MILVIAGMLAGIYWSRWSEPWYKGRSLHSWLEEGTRKWVEGGDEACKIDAEAVRHTGTNAIPALLRMLRLTDSRLTQNLVALHNKFEFLPYPNTADDEHTLAAWGLGWLGSDATNAIPDLMSIYRGNIQQSSEIAYSIMLSIVPPEQRAGLLNEGQTNRYEYVRRMALWELTPTNTPEISVPLLIKTLADPSPRNQLMAAGKLRYFGSNALPAVPALVPLAAMGSSNLYYAAARTTLIVLDPTTAAKVLTNGQWTYEMYTNQQAEAKSREEAIKEGKLKKIRKDLLRPQTNGSMGGQAGTNQSR
jgi:hypothetical protein